MYKKFIYWLLKKHTNILNVSVRVSDFEKMAINEKEQLEKFVFGNLSRAIADDIVRKKLCVFEKRERVWANDSAYTATIRIIK